MSIGHAPRQEEGIVKRRDVLPQQPFLDLCVSSLRKGHAFSDPIVTDVTEVLQADHVGSNTSLNATCTVQNLKAVYRLFEQRLSTISRKMSAAL